MTDWNELFSLEGRVVLVTGGTSGIGAATSDLLRSAGADVVAVGLPDVDVTDPSTLEHLVGSFARLDAVIVAAGIARTSGSMADLDAMLDLHVRSVVSLAELAHPLLADARGAFVVISSIAGLRGNRALGSYGITKAASAQLVRNLAVQWGPDGIRANAISPGVIDTPFATPITEDPSAAEARLARTPLGRFGHPDEVAGAVLWLVSDAGAFVTGQNIVIDGGTLVMD